MRRARWSVRAGASVQQYSTVFDDTADVPYGLGCGGTVDVLLEPASGVAFELLMQAMVHSLDGVAQQVTTWLPGEGVPLRRRVTSLADFTAEEVPGDGMPDEHNLPSGRSALVERLEPPHRVAVLGAGNDAQPLVEMAALLGWDTVVADGRRQWATVERFPLAERVRVVEAGTWGLLRERDAAVIMTHSYEQDGEWLAAALRARCAYVGLLGSRHRSALLMSEAALKLQWPLGRVCERVFAPIGLDLGGDGAPAIALSIAAELQAMFEGKLGGAQRMSADEVTRQVTRGGASMYMQTQCAL